VDYVCLIYSPVNPPPMTPDEERAIFEEYGAFSAAAQASGKMKAGEPLQPTSDATTVRVRDGKRSVTHGPFAETKEWLAGFYILDCNSLDEALDWAAKIPGAKDGSIEVRPVMPIPGRVNA